MARDNHPKERQAKQLERKQKNQYLAGRDRILIVTEGSKTEPLYFEEIRIAYRLQRGNVRVRPSTQGTEPAQVLQYALDLFKNGDHERRIGKRAFEQVFVVFDRDEHYTYYDTLKQIEQLNGTLRNDLKQPVVFRAVPSLPNFELWLLLHYKNIQHRLDRGEVLDRLRQYIPNYKKGINGIFERTRDKINIASQYACDLAKNGNRLSDDTEPYTDVVDLVGWLMALSKSIL